MTNDEINKTQITIPFALYNELSDDSEFLSYLRAAGVDNWEGYDEALKMVEQAFLEEDK